MRRILIAAFLTMGLGVAAQPPKVVNAYNYLRSYKDRKDVDDLRKAQQNIDEAIQNQGTMNKPKTWFYRGNVYAEIAISPLASEVPDALETAADSYLKVYELDQKYETAQEAYLSAMVAYKTLGVLAFNQNKFDKSLSLFEKAIATAALKNNKDKDAIENAAIAAMRGENWDKAVHYLRQTIDMGLDSTGTQYVQLYKAYNAKGDAASAESVLKEGRSKFPKNQVLLTEELNQIFKTGDHAKAESLLQEAIANDPNNHLLWLAAGTTYEALGKRKEALESYEKSIAIKPDAWEAYYNLGANYNNEGRRLQEIANNEKDNKKYEAGVKLADEELKKALVNLEKALEYVPDGKDRHDVLQALRQLYVRLNMTDKYNEVKKELDAMKQ